MNDVINEEIKGAKALLSIHYRMMTLPNANIAMLAREARRIRRYIKIMNNIAAGVHYV